MGIGYQTQSEANQVVGLNTSPQALFVGSPEQPLQLRLGLMTHPHRRRCAIVSARLIHFSCGAVNNLNVLKSGTVGLAARAIRRSSMARISPFISIIRYVLPLVVSLITPSFSLRARRTTILLTVLSSAGATLTPIILVSVMDIPRVNYHR